MFSDVEATGESEDDVNRQFNSGSSSQIQSPLGPRHLAEPRPSRRPSVHG